MGTDTQIIEQINRGKKELYRELVSRYRSKVFSVALKFTHDTKEAEDLSQEIFLQAYQALHTFQGQSSFSTWLYRVAVNRGMDWKRKKQRSMEVAVVTVVRDEIEEMSNQSEPSTENFLVEKEEREKVAEQIHQLPEIYERVISYYYFENLSYLEISERLGITTKTVESRLYRAKKLLKESLAKEGLG